MSRQSADQQKTTPITVAAELRALDRSLDLLDEGVAESFGIKRSDLRAMELVSRDGGLTAGLLATGLGVTTGAVTGLIDRMERMGYFRRQDDPDDRPSSGWVGKRSRCCRATGPTTWRSLRTSFDEFAPLSTRSVGERPQSRMHGGGAVHDADRVAPSASSTRTGM